MGSSAVASFGGGVVWCLAAHVVHALTEWLEPEPQYYLRLFLRSSFKNKLPPVSETWFEPGKILSTTTIYTRRNIASCFESCLVLQQGFPATSAEAEVAVVNISAGFS